MSKLRRNIIKFRAIDKKIFLLSWPAILKNLFHTIIFLVDSSMLGHFSSLSLSAVGVAASFFWGITMILISFTSGVMATVSRFFGEKNNLKVKLALNSAIWIMFLLSAIAAFFLYLFPEKIVAFFTLDVKVIKEGTIYLQTLSLFLIFWSLATILMSGMEAMGNTFSPMIITIIATIFNIIGDYALIFGNFHLPQLGTKGAALATGFSYFIQFLLAFYFLFLKDKIINLKDIFHLNFRITIQIIKISLPSLLENLTMQIGFQIFNKMIALLGAASIAAHRIALSLESLAFMPAVGFGVAGASLVGQNLGKKKFKMALLAGNRAALAGIALMSIFWFLFFFFPVPLVKFFTPDKTLISLASSAIKIGSFEQFSLALSIIYGSCLRGAGDTKSPMLVSLFNSTFLRIGLVYYFAISLKGGLSGVWLATNIDWFVRGMLLMIIFKRARWKKIKI